MITWRKLRSSLSAVELTRSPSLFKIYLRACEHLESTGSNALFLCPAIADGGYYNRTYLAIKRDFGDLPHVIFGSQTGPVSDRWFFLLSDDALVDLYRSTPVFVYSSPEPRHVHYSPLEAMVVGTPVLYLEGGLIDRLAGTRLPGACANVLEMKTKARRLIEGDRGLAEAMRSNQARVLERFAPEVVRRQWAAALFGVAQSS
jgi:glycosyltransferase involved in cell wall biosynthesis